MRADFRFSRYWMFHNLIAPQTTRKWDRKYISNAADILIADLTLPLSLTGFCAGAHTAYHLR